MRSGKNGPRHIPAHEAATPPQPTPSAMITTFRLLCVAAVLATAASSLMAQAPAASAPASAIDASLDDPHLWLEDVLGDKALAWVREHNAQSRRQIEAWPQFQQTRDQLDRKSVV